MSHRLRSYDMGHPGGFPYEEVGPKPRKFRPEPIIEGAAKIVLAYRKGNGLPRATLKDVIEDVDRFQCQRLGNNPRFCVEVNQDDPHSVAMADNTPGLNGVCKGCGAPVL